LSKLNKIIRIFKGNKPFQRVVDAIILRLPFDIGKILRIKIKIQDFNIRLHQSSLSLAYWHNPNDRIEDYSFLTSYLSENDIYIDIGANIGTTVIPAAKRIKAGKVIGFEPHPKTFSFLEDNVRINNLSDSVELQNCALGNERGSVKFSSDLGDDMNKVLTAGEGIIVTVKLLDDVGEKFERIDLIKIDVEGYEKFVVEGGIKTLEKTECIYFEISEDHFKSFGYSVKDLLLILGKIGFRFYMKKEGKLLEEIDHDHKLKEHHANAFAVRNIEEFKKRTGWKVYGDTIKN